MANLLTAIKWAEGFWMTAFSMNGLAEGPFPSTTMLDEVKVGVDFLTGRLLMTILPSERMVWINCCAIKFRVL